MQIFAVCSNISTSNYFKMKSTQSFSKKFADFKDFRMPGKPKFIFEIFNLLNTISDIHIELKMLKRFCM